MAYLELWRNYGYEVQKSNTISHISTGHTVSFNSGHKIPPQGFTSCRKKVCTRPKKRVSVNTHGYDNTEISRQ